MRPRGRKPGYPPPPPPNPAPGGRCVLSPQRGGAARGPSPPPKPWRLTPSGGREPRGPGGRAGASEGRAGGRPRPLAALNMDRGLALAVRLGPPSPSPSPAAAAASVLGRHTESRAHTRELREAE